MEFAAQELAFCLVCFLSILVRLLLRMVFIAEVEDSNKYEKGTRMRVISRAYSKGCTQISLKRFHLPKISTVFHRIITVGIA